jgi:hypothetical protein
LGRRDAKPGREGQTKRKTSDMQYFHENSPDK